MINTFSYFSLCFVLEKRNALQINITSNSLENTVKRLAVANSLLLTSHFRASRQKTVK